MSEADANPETPIRSGFGGLPRWLRIGIIAAATAVLVLIIAVIARVVLSSPAIPLGVTAVGYLLPGSCIVEPGGTSDEYTVVGCSTPHQQQVIARIDLAFPGVDYTADESLAIYADEVCNRLLEYRLYLIDDLEKADYIAGAIAAPTLEEYESGETETLCAVLDHPDRPEKGGKSEDLTRNLYRPMPQ